MGITNRGSISQLLAPDLHKVVISVGKSRPEEYMGLVNEGPMPWNPMKDQQMFGLGPMGTKPEGGTFPLEQIFMGGTVSYTAISYGMALEFTTEGWDDELYGALKEMVGEMAASWTHRKNVDAFAPYNDAFAGATYTGFDGLALCSTAHGTTEPDGATKSNTTSPAVSFSATAIQNAILAFENIRTGRNMPRILTPWKFVLPPAYRFAARELLGSMGRPDTTDNNLNALIQDDLSYRIIHYFDAQKWLLQTKPGDHDVWFYTRKDGEFDAFDDPWTGNAIFTMYGRLASGFGEWRGIYGSNA